MDTAEIEWANPLLPNDIGLELAGDVEANHKTKDGCPPSRPVAHFIDQFSCCQDGLIEPEINGFQPKPYGV